MTEKSTSNLASIGVDVGGTKTRLALFDEKFAAVCEIKIDTPKKKDEFQDELAKAARKLAKSAKEENLKISAAGVGFAGAVDPETGKIRSAPNASCLSGFSFDDIFKEICKSEVALLNDVQAALYGELKLGKAAGCKDVIAIFIGTGIGGAVAINGKMHLGLSGEAGNIGHYLLHAFGPLAGSERHGVLDDFASRLAMAGTAATFAAKGWAPHLLESIGTDVRNIRSSALAEAIRSGDKAIDELVRSRVQIIGIVLSNFVDFLSPEMVVLGGGVTEAMPELVCTEVAAGIQAHSTEAARTHLKVVTAKYDGHAVTVGAAKFALDSRESSSKAA